MKHIIIDTDPGIDDALSLILAFNSPELQVEAVTTVAGNVEHAKGHKNAKRLLEFLGKASIPVCGGAEKPLIRSLHPSEYIHGETGLGEANLSEPSMKTYKLNAVEMIKKKAEELGEKLSLVAIGPLTNIATTILAEPELPQKIGKIIIMGGAFQLTRYGYGNVSAVAEFNIWQDPEAAKIVFDSISPIVVVGLDVTRIPRNRLDKSTFQKIQRSDSPRARLVVDLCRNHIKNFNDLCLHDPMAMTYAIDPNIFITKRYNVDIETQGNLTRGMTVINRETNRKGAELVIDVDGEQFLNLFLNRVVGVSNW